MKLDPIKAIKDLGIPTHSWIVAAQTAGGFRDFCDTQSYNEMIEQISGIKTDYDTLPLAQMTFSYLVQDTVKAELIGNPLSQQVLLNVAEDKATTFVAEQSYHWATTEGSSERQFTVNTVEQVARIAKSLEGETRAVVVAEIAKQLEVMPSTAMTYLRNLTKDNPNDVKIAPPKEKINKRQVALDWVKDNQDATKQEAIAALVEKLETTPAGAQTYYYGAIKLLGIKPTGRSKKVNIRTQLKGMLDANPNMTKIDFLEQAEVQFNVQINTAQTYYYALMSERKMNEDNV